MQKGYIKLYRKGIEHALFKRPLVWHFWNYCLLRANHVDKEIEFQGKPFLIQRGSFIMSLKNAAEDTGLSVQNIRSSIKSLCTFFMIEKSTQQLTKQATLIKVINYDTYQKNDNEANMASNKVPTKCQQSANKVPTINKNVKNYKNVKKKNICGKYSEAFERWWKIYPKRNGRRVGKSNAALQFKKIPENEWQDLKRATENYAKECNGLPKDAERFLKKDFWKDFIKPSESTGKVLSLNNNQNKEQIDPWDEAFNELKKEGRL